MAPLRLSFLPPLVVLLAALIGCSRSSTKSGTVPGGTVTTPSNGLARQLAADAHFDEPEGMAVGPDGAIYVLDWSSCDIVILISNVVTTRRGADTCGSRPAHPTDIAVDSKNTLYLNSGCGVVVVQGASTTTLPGSEGCRDAAGSNLFLGITVDASDNVYYVSANAQCTVKKYDGTATTVVAGGRCGWGGAPAPATEAAVDPGGLAVDADGNLYITDQGSCTVRKVSRGLMTTIAGTGECTFHAMDGRAIDVKLSSPSGIAVASNGDLYVAEGDRIRRIHDGEITTIAGGRAGYSGDGGPATQAGIFAAFDVALDRDGSLYFVEFLNCVVRRVRNGIIDTILGTPCDTYATNPPPTIAPTPTLTGPCSDASVTLMTELVPKRVFHDGEALGVTLAYDAPGCRDIRVAFWGHHLAGSPRYQYYCPQCIKASYAGQLNAGPSALAEATGVTTLIAQPGPFPPAGLDSVPNLEGFQICTAHVTLTDGRADGNEISRDFDVDCGDRGE